MTDLGAAGSPTGVVEAVGDESEDVPTRLVALTVNV